MLADDAIAVDVVEANGFLHITIVFLDLSNSTLSMTIPRAGYAASLRAMATALYVSDAVVVVLVRRHLRPS